MSEFKSIPLELKDLDLNKREIVFSHAVYNNIDHTGDISRKGMFTKSWKENKSSIGFYINHNPGDSPGKTIDVWEDENKAYTQARFAENKEGDDAIEMVESGIISSASFGYSTIRREYKQVRDRRIRELKEVKHLESSLLTYDKTPANSLTGVVAMTKEAGESFVKELKEKIDQLEKFCRSTTVSDKTILSILNEVDELKAIFDKYAPTYAAKAPTPGHTNDFADKLNLITLKHFV